MGKMKELFTLLREQELNAENASHIDDEYQYEQYINEKYKSPRKVCFMNDNDGKVTMLQGNTEQEVLKLAEKHGLKGEFTIITPEKHLF